MSDNKYCHSIRSLIYDIPHYPYDKSVNSNYYYYYSLNLNILTKENI